MSDENSSGAIPSADVPLVGVHVLTEFMFCPRAGLIAHEFQSDDTGEDGPPPRLDYLPRYDIEIFFRYFKHLLGCRHLLSHSQNGIELQVYCAIIACMLISLWTGRKPTLRTYEMVCWYFCGMADADELLAHLNRLKKQA